MRPRRCLVLGLIHGYEAEALRPFLSSLRAAAPDAEVCLAASEITDRTRVELRAQGCTLLPYRYVRTKLFGRKIWPGNTRWRPLHVRYAGWIERLPLSAAARLRLRAQIVRHFLDPNTRRFVEFFLAFGDTLRDYDQVLLSDLRDVVFQSDPFAQLEGYGIVYGLEDPAVTIGSHWANSLWLARVAGEAARDVLAAERVSCVGVVLASGAVMADYLRLLVEALTRPGVDVANFHGADTGAHNLVVRRGHLPGVRFADFATGGILNMHGLRAEFIRWNRDGFLCDARGATIPIVHQYDRHPEVAAKLLARLGVAGATVETADRWFRHS